MASFLRALRRTASRLSFRKGKRKKRSGKHKIEMLNQEDTEQPTSSDFINEKATAVDNPNGGTIDDTTKVEIHVTPPQTETQADDKVRSPRANNYDMMESGEEEEKEKLRVDPEEIITSATFSSGDDDEETDTIIRKKSKKWGLRKRISATLFHPDLEKCDPEICVNILRIPNVKSFSSLKKKIQHSKGEWIQGFLDAGGLDVLLDHVDTLGMKRVQLLSDAILLLECVACIKVVLNSRLGMDYLIQHGDYTKKLVKGKKY